MISVDRKAKDLETVLNAVLERKEKIKNFIVVTFDYQDNAYIQYSTHWHQLGVAASLCQGEFHHCYTEESGNE